MMPNDQLKPSHLDLGMFFPEYMKIIGIEEHEDNIGIILVSQTHNAKCPICGYESDKPREYFMRPVNDLPIFGKPVILYVNVQEYSCTNKDCSVKTFREQLPGFLGVKALWTNRCQDFILSLAAEMSCEAASVFCQKIGIKVSGDTIIRMMLRNTREIPFIGDIIGVDDWAFKKNQSYGTLICDGVTHKPIALLPGRDGQSFREWLQNNPQIKTVTRDRASAYSAVINDVIPGSKQIADKFHLFENLLDAVKESLKTLLPERVGVKLLECGDTNDSKAAVITEEPSAVALEASTAEEEPYCVKNFENNKNSGKSEQTSNDSEHLSDQVTEVAEILAPKIFSVEDESKKDTPEINAAKKEQDISLPLSKNEEDNRLLILEVQRLSREELLSNTEIKKKVGISYRRIKRYLSGDADELCRDGRHGAARSSALDQYNTVIKDMLAQRKTRKEIYHYLRGVGYSGSYSRVADYCAKNFGNNKKNASASKGCDHFIGRKSVLNHIWSDQPLNDDDKKYIFDEHPELTNLKDIVVNFQKAMKTKKIPLLNQWIDTILQSGFAAMQSLGNGIKQDLEAVLNSLRFDENNGFLEGNVNRLKAIKRSMFGRAKLPLLKAKILRLCDFF